MDLTFPQLECVVHRGKRPVERVTDVRGTLRWFEELQAGG